MIQTFVYKRSRHDFYEMATHHFATIMLVYSTYSLNIMKLGGPIMLIHNYTDIYIQVLKISFEFCATKG